MAEVEKTHWWFRSRRKIVRSIITKYTYDIKNKNCEILSVGCGTGGNFQMLCKFGKIFAMDVDSKAVEISRKLNIADVEKGKLPHQIPFGNKCFDIITATDVLEHINDDKESLIAISKRLNQKGKLILTVPAHNYLWSKHDELHHHVRRYSKEELINKLKETGFNIEFISYYNFFLFPIVYIVRSLTKNKENITPDELNKIPNKLVNKILEYIFSFEKFFLGWVRFPQGVSLIAVVSKIQ